MEPTGVLGVLAGALNVAGNDAPPHPQRPWYSVRNLAQGEAEIFIYDFIGFDPFFGGVGAADFVRELRAINAPKILLRINSPGGDITEAVAIRTALKEHPAEIETHIDGIAASSASWVGLAGDSVLIAPHATMMIHEPWNIVAGDAETMRKVAEELDLFGGEIAEMYQEKAGGAADDWRAKMREETWFTDQEAVDAGLADEIAGQPADAAANRYDPAILTLFRNTPPHLTQRPQTQPPASNDDPPPPADSPANLELVRAVLDYQRDESRRLGVAV